MSTKEFQGLNTTGQCYIIKCINEEYDVLFHRPSSKAAKVTKEYNVEDLSEADIYEKYPILNSLPEGDKVKELGKEQIALTFMSARTCNLGCTYCFAGEGEYGCEVDKPPFFTYDGYMRSIKTALKMYPEGIKSICFFGGEPILNYREIKRFIPDCIEFFKQNNKLIPAFSIATNLVLFDDEMAEFFAKYNVYFVISLDGPKEVNDIARVMKKSNDSVYDAVKHGCEILDKYNINYVVQATINVYHMERYERGYAVS